MNISKRAVLTLLAGLAIALGVGVVATAKQSPEQSQALAKQLVTARLATAKYATNLDQAKADGYQIITQMIPDMGWHFMNPKITGFDVSRPPILVYERKGNVSHLAALEWVFTKRPATPAKEGPSRAERALAGDRAALAFAVGAVLINVPGIYYLSAA